LACDGNVWCDGCHSYSWELLRPRDFQEMEAWSAFICTALGMDPVPLVADPDPAHFRKEASVVTAEADHGQQAILLYPPGCRLTTLCHELAHLFTGEDHTERWAAAFARLVAWVRERLEKDEGPPGWPARLPIYPGPPFTVKR
jgi:hypothetical protein